jgi:GxxExxY protein
MKLIGAKARYGNLVVGEYFMAPLVEDVLLVELTTVKALDDSHCLQCINYLKTTGGQLRRPPNFSKSRKDIKRVAHDL